MLRFGSGLAMKPERKGTVLFLLFLSPRTDQKLPERGCLLLSSCSVPSTACPCQVLGLPGQTSCRAHLREVGTQQPPAFRACTAALPVAGRKLVSTYVTTLYVKYPSWTNSHFNSYLKNLSTLLLFFVFLRCCLLTLMDPGPIPQRRKSFQLIIKSLSKLVLQEKEKYFKSLSE